MSNYRYNSPEYMRKMKEPAEPFDEMALAMAYVPWQNWCDIYDVKKGFCYGTIFAQLNKPFKGGRCS